MKLNDLSVEERLGQRFIFGVNSHNIECIIRLIKDNYIGGVILYKRNYSSYNEMLDIIKKLKNANKNNKIPLFISIDQEGGRVNRFPDEIHVIKNNYDVSRCSNELVYDSAVITGELLSNMGINMNFAPVLDIYNNFKSKALYKRCFYGNYDAVANSGIKYINGLKNNKIISVVKHFPGHGASLLDSHFIVPYVFRYNNILNNHILPFYNLIDNDIDAIMVGHIVVRKLTKLLPASISDDFIKNYLIDKKNYKGLIITDEVNMLKRNLLYKFIFMNKILKSSSDIVLVKVKKYEEALRFINRYKNILENDTYLGKLNMSVNKIIDIKEKYGINDNTNYDGININIINEKIDKLNELVKEK